MYWGMPPRTADASVPLIVILTFSCGTTWSNSTLKSNRLSARKCALSIG
jgi:hypothetical protein